MWYGLASGNQCCGYMLGCQALAKILQLLKSEPRAIKYINALSIESALNL